jgi:ribosomal protein S18 acetylase RimI-like enzyme
MNFSIVLCPTQAKDLDVVLSIVEEFYRHFNYDFSRDEKSQSLQEIWADAHQGCLWLIEKDRTVVGYIYLAFYFSIEFGGKTAFIDELFILPEHRGQGIGSEIISLAEEQCRRLKLKALHLESERTNQRATALYLKLGFMDYDRRLLTKRF